MATAVLVGGAASASAAVETPVLLKTVTVKASEFKFALSSKSAKRGVVIFKVTNIGKVSHDFEIKGRKTPMLSHGKSDTLRVTFLRKGTYPYKCTVPGHAAAGMKGVFTIT
jgi:uncharacterized cupredoxin-like copper-binding protein